MPVPTKNEAWLERRARELAQADIDEYFADRIDEKELNRRKRSARQRASSELGAVAELDAANAAYEVAKEARVAAEHALAMATKLEDDAADRVEEALRVVQGQSGITDRD